LVRFIRRLLCPLLVGMAALLAIELPASQEVPIPARLQAQLVAKVAAYDARFLTRAHGHAVVLIVVAPGAAESARFSDQIRAELANQPKIGGVGHTEEIVKYSSASDLARLCRERGAALVYIAPSLSDVAQNIAEALTGVDILSVAAVPEDVSRRLVLGFALEAGKPKLLVNLGQARLQHVAFDPELLRLARVIQ
jgi:hypothetical protein